MWVETLNKIFGKYINQPLHVTLADFNIVYVIALLMTGVWCDTLFWYILDLEASQLTAELAGLLWGQFLLLVGMFWKAIHDMRQNIKDRENT